MAAALSEYFLDIWLLDYYFKVSDQFIEILMRSIYRP